MEKGENMNKILRSRIFNSQSSLSCIVAKSRKYERNINSYVARPGGRIQRQRVICNASALSMVLNDAANKIFTRYWQTARLRIQNQDAAPPTETRETEEERVDEYMPLSWNKKNWMKQIQVRKILKGNVLAAAFRASRFSLQWMGWGAALCARPPDPCTRILRWISFASLIRQFKRAEIMHEAQKENRKCDRPPTQKHSNLVGVKLCVCVYCSCYRSHWDWE